MSKARTVAEVVANGLCIGCGLCESVTGGRVPMVMAEVGALRPSSVDDFSDREEATVLSACPGVVARSRPLLATVIDPIWGAHGTMRYGWAGDPDIRFEASTGGVLTALGMFILATGQVESVLHVGHGDGDGLVSPSSISKTPADVRAKSGSRYAPTAPLTLLHQLLDRQVPFGLIAKPCDVAAVHALADVDPRLDEYCRFRLAMVCGGQSRQTKSIELAQSFGVDEPQVSSIRYRGHGNPGPTVLRTTSGSEHRVSYSDMWADESTWDLEARCTICPDALGEAADVAAADVWPGGGPTGEDEGFNGVIAYSPAGETLIAQAVEAAALVLGEPILPRRFDELQPHQVRKKQALQVRSEAFRDAGKPTIATEGLRVDQLGAALDETALQAERAGTKRRIERGRYEERPTYRQSGRAPTQS